MSKELEARRIPKRLTVPLERQREETIATLKTAFEEGEMTLEEYDERVSLALSASGSAELEVLTEELKPELSPVPVSTPKMAVTKPVQRPIRAIFGEVRQAGVWVLAPKIRPRAVFGEVRLDLSDVEWVENHAEIDCKAVFGSIVIIVPPGVFVDCAGVGILGSFNNKTQTRSSGATHRLTVRGSAVFGSVEVVSGE